MIELCDIRADTPRLVVTFKRGHDGSEQFQWGIVGQIPILSLIGAVARAQGELEYLKEVHPCDQPVLAIVWEGGDARQAACYVHPDIPTDPLCGMLETIKAALVGSRLAQHQAAQRVLGPDGVPMRS